VSGDSVVAGRFAIEREAGAGGMARVYRARDLATGDIIALKVLNHVADADLQRFAREVSALGELRHPSIVRYVAHGETDRGQAFLAMEWLDGEGLDARLSRGALAVDDAVAVAAGVAGALAEAHARGLVHRDVKPANVFLAGGDCARPKLLDFGIARDAISELALTRTGELLGTPLYMAPEQARGDRDLDARVDVYALGAMLYALLAGVPPIIAPNLIGLLAKIVVEDPVPVEQLRPNVPAELARLVGAMLAKSRDDRPADAAAVAAALAAVPETGEAGQAIAGARSDHAPPTIREQRVVSILMASGLVATAAPFADTAALATLSAGSAAAAGGPLVLADGTRLVVFAGPESPGDLAARAASYALGLRGTAPSAIAIATGRAVLAGDRPVGEVIDRAARLLAGARGAIRCDVDTAGLIESRFELEPDDAGATIVGARGADGETVDTLLGKPSRCVGRDRELSALEGYYAESVGECAARAVLVIADAGVGKSRLARELVRRLEARDDPPGVWIARGEPASMASPFAGIASAIARAAHVELADSLPVRSAKLEARLDADGVPAELAEFIFELVGCTLHEPSERLRAARVTPALMFDHLRDAWVGWLALLAARQPQLVVIEDLHWLDASSASLVAAALGALAERSLLVVGLARPEVRDRTPPLLGAHRPHELRLDPLAKRASERLVRDALGARATDDRVADIVGRAAGNALFLEELVRAASTTRGASVPIGVIGTVQLRFDALSGDARLAVRAAAVLGERFARDAVGALLPDSVDVFAALGELVRAEVIAADGPAGYRFRHGLVRDAAYELIADDDRAREHGLAGDHLAASDAVDAAVVARHYELARRAGDCARWYRRAAEHALAHHDLAAAIRHAQHAHDWLAQGDVVGGSALDQIVSEAELWRGNLTAARASAERAIERLDPGEAEWIGAAGLIITTAGQLGDNATVAAWLERVIAIDAGDAATGVLVRALSRASSQLAWTDYEPAARAALARANALTYARELDPMTAARLAAARGTAAFADATFAASFAYLADAIAILERVGAPRDAMLTVLTFSAMRAFAGLAEDSVRDLDALLVRATAIGATYIAYGARFQLALAHNVLGNRELAWAYHDACPDTIRSTPLFRAGFAATGTWAAFDAGDLDTSAALGKQLEEPGLARRFNACGVAARALILVRRDAGGAPARDEAAVLARRALAVLQREPMRAEARLAGMAAAVLALREAGAPDATSALAAHRALIWELAALAGRDDIRAGFLNLPWNRAILELPD
jgi:hypothetical protein